VFSQSLSAFPDNDILSVNSPTCTNYYTTGRVSLYRNDSVQIIDIFPVTESETEIILKLKLKLNLFPKMKYP